MAYPTKNINRALLRRSHTRRTSCMSHGNVITTPAGWIVQRCHSLRNMERINGIRVGGGGDGGAAATQETPNSTSRVIKSGY